MRLTIKDPGNLLSVVLDREVTQQQVDKIADLLNEEWCLHCGGYLHACAPRHNAAYGMDSPAGAGEEVEAFRG